MYIIDEVLLIEGHWELITFEINPLETFSMSALIEPHILTTMARSCKPSRVIAFDANKLIDLFAEDPQLGTKMMRCMAQSAIEQLQSTRILLAT